VSRPSKRETPVAAASEPPGSNSDRKSNLSRVPCRFWNNGYCSAGDNCRFSHDQPNAQQPETSNVPCRFFLQGTCQAGKRCLFSHTLEEESPGQPTETTAPSAVDNASASENGPFQPAEPGSAVDPIGAGLGGSSLFSSSLLIPCDSEGAPSENSGSTPFASTLWGVPSAASSAATPAPDPAPAPAAGLPRGSRLGTYRQEATASSPANPLGYQDNLGVTETFTIGRQPNDTSPAPIEIGESFLQPLSSSPPIDDAINGAKDPLPSRPPLGYATVAAGAAEEPAVRSTLAEELGAAFAQYHDPRANAKLCAFFINGNCRYGEMCHNLHGLECPHCARNILHPFDALEAEAHINQCEKNLPIRDFVQGSKHLECGICFDRPATKNRCFGILSSCEHSFCLECIREWRGGNLSKETVRACPICRIESHLVIPSSYMPPSLEDKEALLASYRARLGTIPCKYFDAGKGTCPFGVHCFYLHRLPDGRVVIPEAPRKKVDADGSVEVVRSVNLGDFLFMAPVIMPPPQCTTPQTPHHKHHTANNTTQQNTSQYHKQHHLPLPPRRTTTPLDG